MTKEDALRLAQPAREGAFKGFTHVACDYHPCHSGVRRSFNCLFCYCPLMERECPGPYKVFKDAQGRIRKDCSDCALPHDGIDASWRFIQRWLKAADPWCGRPQSPARVRELSRAVRQAIGD